MNVEYRTAGADSAICEESLPQYTKLIGEAIEEALRDYSLEEIAGHGHAGGVTVDIEINPKLRELLHHTYLAAAAVVRPLRPTGVLP